MSTHNMCFYGEIKKQQIFGCKKVLYLELCVCGRRGGGNPLHCAEVH